MNIQIQIEDCRPFSQRAVEVANLLGSDLQADYQTVEDWLKKSTRSGSEMFLVDMFRIDGGILASEKVKEN